MIIALDYDDTYTAAPELWDEFIEVAMRRGHDVICVTCRRDTEENRAECKIPLALNYLTHQTSLLKW